MNTACSTCRHCKTMNVKYFHQAITHYQISVDHRLCAAIILWLTNTCLLTTYKRCKCRTLTKKITNYKSRVNNLDEIFNVFETPTRVVLSQTVWYKKSAELPTFRTKSLQNYPHSVQKVCRITYIPYKKSAELPTFRTKTLQNYLHSSCVPGLLLRARHLN